MDIYVCFLLFHIPTPQEYNNFLLQAAAIQSALDGGSAAA